ncbi:MAG: hypothetical protein ACRC5A_03385 [Enterobacteriaceae bacterium]
MLMSVSQYAKHSKMSRTAFYNWESKDDFPKRVDGKVDATACDAYLARYRVAQDPRTKNAERKKEKITTAMTTDAPIPPEDTTESEVQQIMMATGAKMSLEEARRFKENYLALMAQLTYQKESGEVVELSIAENVLFKAFRAQRDSWLNWPARVAPLIAADLNIEADRVTEVLTGHVHEHLTRLSQPEFNIQQD